MKKRYIHCFALCLLAWAVAGQARAAEPRSYRVDVIVFTHLTGGSDQRLAREIADFGAFLDVATHARAAAWTPPDKSEAISDDERARLDALATLDQIRALENPAKRSDGRFRGGPAFPTPWLGLDHMVPAMDAAWQRLVTSQAHEPLAWRSWYQTLGRNAQGRAIRLRGGRLLDLDWLARETANPDYLDDHQPGPFPFLLPRSRHQLDGKIQLRRRQFIHANLDLVWQAPVEAMPSPLAADWYQPPGFSIHPMEQSRSIRPGRIEYFDSSWLGVLIFIQPWESPLTAELDERDLP